MPATDIPASPAPLWRRVGSMVYDGLLLLASYMVATLLFLPFTGGEALTLATNPVLERIYQLALVLVTLVFFSTFWTLSGQTLGMQAWRLRVERSDGGPLTLRDCVIRLTAAVLAWLPLGLGFLWVLVDPQRRAWHDRLSGTRIVLLPKRKAPASARPHQQQPRQ
jgi:uncharacterized RDD family membrane protein YckC